MKIRLDPRRIPSNEDLHFAAPIGEARRRLRESAKADTEASGAADSTPAARSVSDLCESKKESISAE